MKKQKNLIFGIIIVLLLATAILAVLHLNTRTQEQAGTLQITCKGETLSLPLAELPVYDVSGITIDGKGEKSRSRPRVLLFLMCWHRRELI